MMHGELREGPKALTVIALPRGRFRSLFLFCDNNRQNMLPVDLRIALFHHGYGGFQVRPAYTLDGSSGPMEIKFEDAEHIGGVSIERQDEGDVHVAWTVL
jgi:hypothetical protein